MNATLRANEFTITNTRNQHYEYTNSTVRIHEFHFIYARIQRYRYTNSTVGMTAWKKKKRHLLPFIVTNAGWKNT